MYVNFDLERKTLVLKQQPPHDQSTLCDITLGSESSDPKVDQHDLNDAFNQNNNNTVAEIDTNQSEV